jgi:hypothetical protein
MHNKDDAVAALTAKLAELYRLATEQNSAEAMQDIGDMFF